MKTLGTYECKCGKSEFSLVEKGNSRYNSETVAKCKCGKTFYISPCNTNGLTYLPKPKDKSPMQVMA